MTRPARFVRGTAIAASCLVLIVGGVLGADGLARAGGSSAAQRTISLVSQDDATPEATERATATDLATAGRTPEPTHSPRPAASAEAGDDRGVDDPATHDVDDDRGGTAEAGDDRGGDRDGAATAKPTASASPTASPGSTRSPRPSASPKPTSSTSGSGGSGSGGSDDGSGHH